MWVQTLQGRSTRALLNDFRAGAHHSIIPQVSGVGLVSCDLGNHLLVQGRCLCSLHSWRAVLSLTREQGWLPCCSCFTKKPRRPTLCQTNLSRVGSGRQGPCTSHFSSRCSFLCEKKFILQHIEMLYNSIYENLYSVLVIRPLNKEN